MIRVDRTGPDLGASVAALGKGMRDANRKLGRDIGRTARAEQLDAARQIRGGLSMSGMGGRLGAKARTFAGPNRVTVVVEPKPAGMWAIVEAGATIPRTYPRARRAVTPPKGPSASAPGGHQTGRRVWSRAAEAAAEPIADAVEALYDAALEA